MGFGRTHMFFGLLPKLKAPNFDRSQFGKFATDWDEISKSNCIIEKTKLFFSNICNYFIVDYKTWP